MNQRDVQKVSAHLVDESRSAEPTMSSRLRQVALPESCELPARQLCERPRVGRRLPRLLAVAELQAEADDFGQLARTLDLRVAGKNLLEQRRARSRQADDENRVRRRASPSGARRKEFRRAE